MYRLSPAQTSAASGPLCSQRSSGKLPGPFLVCSQPWEVPGFLCVFKTSQQHPLARGQPQARSELLSRVRARVPFTGITLWQLSGCCDHEP